MIRVGSLLVQVQPQADEQTQDSMINKSDYVDLGLACADVCVALDRGMKGGQVDKISRSVFEAIEQLTKWVQLVTHRSQSIYHALIVGP